MKIYYSSEFIGKLKPKLVVHTALAVLFYVLVYDLSKGVFFIFLGAYCISIGIKSFHLVKYHRHLPIADYDETGIVVLFGYRLAIPAERIGSVEFSQHKLTFVLKDGKRVGTQLRDMMPHDDFDRLVEFFAARFPHQQIA
ncbi:MAG: hypothetical protein ACOZCK_04650 [Pseudomonadota bacterium]|jgi:hypothetical protein